jgi:putative ABC transport system permease protein
MIMLKLAIRNLVGAGLRTWLNIFILSIAYVAIIGMQGIYEGMNDYISRVTIEYDAGAGQWWTPGYDPYDALSFDDAHSTIPSELNALIDKGQATAVLARPATIYPNGRMRTIVLKGISPEQQVIKLPTAALKEAQGAIPALIGKLMARKNGIAKGDLLTVRWRDAHGTFDARDVQIVEILNTSVPAVENGQIWIPLRQLQEMTAMEGQATWVTLATQAASPATAEAWSFHSQFDLLKDIRELVETKKAGGSILYALLLLLSLLAIFDTQILSIFRRRKEIGTLMALGMTRGRLVRLFTFEGALHGLLAALLAILYGGPLLMSFAENGMSMPGQVEDYGLALGEKLMPVYSLGLVLGTTALILITVTIVSYFPTRKIVKMNPTEALRGNLS